MAPKKRQVKAQQKTTSAQKKSANVKDEDQSFDDASQILPNEDSKSEDSQIEAGDDDEQQMNDIINKYGFRHQVELDMILPSGERETIPDFNMTFLDRNFQAKQNLELGIGDNKGDNMLNNPAFPKPNGLYDSTSDYECTLSDVVIYLKKCGYPLENCFVAFQSPVFSAFINCGLDPLPNSIKITKEDLTHVKNQDDDKFKLELKFQWGIRSEYKNEEDGGQEQAKEETMTQSGRTQRRVATMTQQSQHDKEHKRTKERTIGYIIEKVSQWRKLYNGYMDENHQLRRMSLEDAAAKVQVSKKSLDDYLSQLRQGRALGFNFNQHKDEKVGYLRQFVKENSAKNQKLGGKKGSYNEGIQQAQMSQPELSKKNSKKGGKR